MKKLLSKICVNTTTPTQCIHVLTIDAIIYTCGGAERSMNCKINVFVFGRNFCFLLYLHPSLGFFHEQTDSCCSGQVPNFTNERTVTRGQWPFRPAGNRDMCKDHVIIRLSTRLNIKACFL